MSNKIREIANEKGIKFSHIIGKTGLAKSSFYKIMEGDSIPSLENARAIAKAMDVTLEEIFPDNNIIEEE